MAKHVPHAFNWKHIDEAELITQKQKKGKTRKIRAGDQQIKQPPVLLKDGDHIGVRIGDNTTNDDFQTLADEEAGEAFRELKKEELAQREADKKKKRKGYDDAEVKFFLDDDDEEAPKIEGADQST